jgi:hypothetical protein
MELILKDYQQLKDVENFLFRFIYSKSFNLRIIIESTNEIFNYTTKYNDFAKGLVLETF